MDDRGGQYARRAMNCHPRGLAAFCCALLDSVRQLVGQQSLARIGVRVIPARAKIEILPVGESLRLDRMVQFSRLTAGVDSHTTEVLVKARLHKRPGFRR